MISRGLNILELLKKKASVLLLGPRGTGKTALIGSTSEGISSQIRIDLLQGSAYQLHKRGRHG